MSWPDEAGSIAFVSSPSRKRPRRAARGSTIVRVLWRAPRVQRVIQAARGPARRRGLPGRLVNPAPFRLSIDGELRGLFRIFNPALYRFYRSNTDPPEEGDSPFDTNATLPHTPADTFVDDVWYLAMSRFNGVIDSGFLPLGPNGETYLRLRIATGGAGPFYTPPNAPNSWHLELEAGGVVRVRGLYAQTGANRADTWAISYTTDESTPPANNPDVTAAIPPGGPAVLSYALPGQADGTTVKVRVQTRRLNGATQTYSGDSIVQEIDADAVGPSVPVGLQTWRGRLPESV